MKNTSSLIGCLLWGMNLFAQPQPTAEFPFKMTVDQYVDKYSPLAVDEMYRNRIPASIILAQGLLESGNGNSRLAIDANNHFGIKCKSDWTGDSIKEDDDEAQECFRKYATAIDSYKDHSDFLKKGQRYVFLFDLEITDYKSWASGLRKAGYATNPRYAEILITTIEKNNLQRFDLMQPAMQEEKKIDQEKQEAVESHENLVINNIPALVARAGETYTSIALDHDMRVWQVYKFNDRLKSDTARMGDTIYLKAKNYKGPIPSVMVGEADNMYKLSQRYAIKLSRLLKMNLLSDGMEPAVGETIFLQEKRITSPLLRELKMPLAKADTAIDEQVYEDAKKNVETSAPALPSDPFSLEDKGIADAMAFFHIVQPKETLFSIAKKYNVQVEGIKTLNNLKKDDIKVNDKLIINPNQPPIKPNEESVVPGYHQVQTGETIYSISRLYNTTVGEIKALNQLVNDTIRVGDELIVVPLNGEKEGEEKVSDAPDEPVYHTVKEKETMYSISRKYNLEASEIRKQNNMSDNNIFIGQRLRIR